MSLKLGNTDLNRLLLGSTEINKAYLGVDVVFTSVVVLYLRNLTDTNQDYLSITNAELNTDIPSTGVFEYGGVFTIPVTPVFQGMAGRTVSGFSLGKYGFYSLNTGELRVQAAYDTTFDIPNYFLDYGGQTIEIKVRYEGLDCIVFINSIEVGRATLIGTRPAMDVNTFFVGVYGDAGGVTPLAGSYFNGKIHSAFIGSNIWGMNEPIGFDCISDVGGYVMAGKTSNAGQLTYWESNVIQLDV